MSRTKLAEGGFLLCATMIGFVFMVTCISAEVSSPMPKKIIHQESQTIVRLQDKIKAICRGENPKLYKTLK